MIEHELPPKSPETPRTMASVVEQAKRLERTIARCEPDLAGRLVDQLNRAAVDAMMLGQRATLRSDYLTRHCNVLSSDAQVSGRGVVEVDDAAYAGTFVGFEQWRHQDGTFLMYRLELPMEGELPRFDSVWAPVGDASLEITLPAILQPSEEAEIQEDADFLAATLARRREPSYREDLADFFDCFEGGDMTSVERITDLAASTSALFAHLDSERDRDVYSAALRLIGRLFPPDYYHIDGDLVAPYESIGRRQLAVEPLQGIYKVDGIGLVEDYEKQPDGELVVSDLVQPALRIVNMNNGYDYVPLSSLLDFAQIGEPVDDSCSDAIARYKEWAATTPA